MRDARDGFEGGNDGRKVGTESGLATGQTDFGDSVQGEETDDAQETREVECGVLGFETCVAYTVRALKITGRSQGNPQVAMHSSISVRQDSPSHSSFFIMSLFFDYKIDLKGDEVAALAWSRADAPPLLAVASTTGKILIFSEEGDPVPDLSMPRDRGQPAKMTWHPKHMWLYIAWEDGGLTYYNVEERQQKEDKSVHGGKICGLTMSPNGSRMVTGDDHGVVAVWSISRGLSPICQFHKEGSIFEIAYCALAGDNGEIPGIERMNTYFFFGGSSGSVSLADDSKRCSEVCKVEGQIKSILYYREDNSLIIITSKQLLVQFRVTPHERLAPTRKVKLTVGGNPEEIRTIWGGTGLLVTVSGENMLRLWNLEQDKNYFLTLADADMSGKLLRDQVLSVAYQEQKRVLAGGTKEGRVVMWRSKSIISGEAPASSEGWDPYPPVSLSDLPIVSLSWSETEGLLGASSKTHFGIIAETKLQKKVKETIMALQVSNNMVEIRRIARYESPMQVQTSVRIKGLDVSERHLIVWNGLKVEVFAIGEIEATPVGSFEKKAMKVGLHEESVVAYCDGHIEVCNFHGIVRQTLSLSETEGSLVDLDLLNSHMAVVTSTHIKIYDCTRREFRLIGMPRKFEDKKGQSMGVIREAVINIQGTKIAMLVDQTPKPELIYHDTNVYVYDSEIDNFLYYDCGAKSIPTRLSWDTMDSRLLLVEVEQVAEEGVEEARQSTELKREAVALFVTAEYGINKQDAVALEAELNAIMGSSVPYQYFIGKDTSGDSVSGYGKVIRRSMRDFTGLENCDETIRKAILNFSFLITAGNMDEAYKTVKAIQNIQVWEKMCQMSVKTRRLDVAEVCLGNMRFARGARALREAKKDPDQNAQLAMVALQLNMLEDARKLYEESERFDLLNEMLQAAGEWEAALEVAEKHDRINLKTTLFKQARHYEALQDVPAAIEAYEQSGTHREEVPRMLYQQFRHTDLERYINSKADKDLYRWWAQLVESKDDKETALRYYKLAEDYGNYVRLLCLKEEFDRAEAICNETKDPIACFYLAKHYEKGEYISEAIQYYSYSGRFYHAVTLAKANKRDGEVMSLSLQSGDVKIMTQSASYFEGKHLFDKAIVLYHKGKNVRKALDLCFQAGNQDYLKTLVDDLGEEEDTETLARAAEYFLTNKVYDKAVHLLVSSRQYSTALDLCLKHNVRVDENMVEKMLPDSTSQDPARQVILRSMAKLCKKQGSFQLACKLFTKAGEKMKGFKSLLKLGSVEKIVYYANMAKNAQIYVMAANYLQSCPWHNDSELMKNIMQFYTKAKSWDHLSNFLDTCATVEIDEYRDYEKALTALKEAVKYNAKSTSYEKETKQQQLLTRINLLERFVQARGLAGSNPEEMVRICVALVETPGVEQSIRIGDVYAQLVEYYYNSKQYQQAYSILTRMLNARININPYIDRAMVENIYKQLGLKMQPKEDEPDEDIEY